MLVSVIEIKRGIGKQPPSIKEIYINSSHIVSVSEESMAIENLIKESKNLGLVENVQFSKIVLTEGSMTRSITVIGSPQQIYSKIKKKQILRG